MSDVLSSVVRFPMAMLVIGLLLVPGTPRSTAFGQFVGGDPGGSESNNNEENSSANESNTQDPNANDPNNVRVINGNTAGISIDARAVVRRALGRAGTDLDQLRMSLGVGRAPQEPRRSSKLGKNSSDRLNKLVSKPIAFGKSPTEADDSEIQVNVAPAPTSSWKAIHADWRSRRLRRPTGRPLNSWPRSVFDSGNALDRQTSSRARRDGIRVDRLGNVTWWWD